MAEDGRFSWHRWDGRQRGLLRHKTEVEDPDSYTQIFDELYTATFGSDEPGKCWIAMQETETAYSPPSPPFIQPVSQLRFDLYKIPPYQRPYKWTIKNTNQLVDDILRFQRNSAYRLGTLVLYNPASEKPNASLEVVDGQQRIITLALLLYLLMEDKRYAGLFSESMKSSLSSFLAEPQFHEALTRKNILANLQALRQRLPEFEEEKVNFLLERCEFVIILLHDISEAFQFFDAQNARGKELAPHDLLKAFHLRAIMERDDKDRENIAAWENNDTETLEFLFLTLFRVKSWIKAREGRFFTSKDIDEFKGLDETNYGLPFQNIYTIAQCYTELYNRDVARRLDRNKLDYPHQIDQVVINGSLFFDMIKFYKEKLDALRNAQEKAHSDIMKAIRSFKDGLGNRYAKFLFDSACLFYYDKFGEEGFGRAMEKIFAWTYGKRLTSYSLKLASIDNLARGYEGFFAMLHNAIRPADVLNWSVPVIYRNDIQSNQKYNTAALALLEKLHYVN